MILDTGLRFIFIRKVHRLLCQFHQGNRLKLGALSLRDINAYGGFANEDLYMVVTCSYGVEIALGSYEIK